MLIQLARKKKLADVNDLLLHSKKQRLEPLDEKIGSHLHRGECCISFMATVKSAIILL